MTLSQQFNPAHFTADGERREWTFEFSVPAGGEVVGTITSPQGTQSKITENMSVDLVNKIYTYPTLASGLAPLPQGWRLTLMRQTACTQEVALSEQDAVPYHTMEEGLDKLTYLMQETKEEVSRAVKFSCDTQNPQTDAAQYIQTIQGISAQAASSATAAQNSAGVAAQYAQSAQQDYSTLSAQVTALATTVHDNQITDQTYANTVAANALTVAEAYSDSKLATEISARQSADETLQSNINAEASSRQSADETLQAAINTKQAAGDYATNTALTNGLALKQNVLSSAQQAAVDSGVTSNTVSQVGTNAQQIAALTAELEAAKPWQKPASWVDIRTGAQTNSIYLLVGHKADFSKYNEFPIKVAVNNSGTYDIYIDGVKKYSAVASDTETLLNWQTLNLTSGFDVTYPEALRTHIIRVTPTVSTNNLEYPSFVKNTLSNVGLLWLHFTTDYTLYIPQMCYAGGCNAPVLEAVTSSTGFLKAGWMELSFYEAISLKEIPIIEIVIGSAGFNDNFRNAKIRKLEYKLDAQFSSNRSCDEPNLPQCEEIVNTTQYSLHTSSFANCPKLKRIRGFFSKTYPDTMGNLFGGDVSMEEMLLDFSEGAQVKKLVIGGTSSVPLPWFKGLTVSASAPFDGTSPQLDVAYTGMTRDALVTLFDSLPTVSDSQVCNVTGASGAADLSAADIAVATAKGWSVTR